LLQAINLSPRYLGDTGLANLTFGLQVDRCSSWGTTTHRDRNFDEKSSPSSRLGRPSKNGSPTTNRTSTGSTGPGIQPTPTRTSSTKGWRGGHPKSNWTTTAFWSSNFPDSARRAQETKINRCFKNPWHCGLGKLCSDGMTNAMKTPDCAGTRQPDGLSPFQFSAFQFFQSPLSPSTPFSPPSGPARTLSQGPPAKSKFLAI
jgi:hypothetical protein